MPPRGSLTRVVAAGAALLAVLAGGFLYFFSFAPAQDAAALKANLASGYATQSLGAPFVLDSRSWNPDSRQWVYLYHANLSVADTTAAAKTQLSKGAYQVNAHHPDFVSADSAILYRDLITEDEELSVQIRPASNSASGATTTVTLSKL